MQLNIMYDLPVYSFDIIMKYICCIYILYIMQYVSTSVQTQRNIIELSTTCLLTCLFYLVYKSAADKRVRMYTVAFLPSCVSHYNVCLLLECCTASFMLRN